jgi:hypothetical protein
MRALYALASFAFFLIMLGLMVWSVVDDVSGWLFIPAFVSGTLGFMFAGASKGERDGGDA